MERGDPLTMYIKFNGKRCGVWLNKLHTPINSEFPRDNFRLSLAIRDDAYWTMKNFSMSAFWIDDLIKQLQAAKSYIDIVNNGLPDDT